VRAVFSPLRFVLALLVLSAGCFQGVHPDPSTIQCKGPNNCPDRYTCVKAKAGDEYGRCVSGTADAGRDQGSSDSVAIELDGATLDATVALDGKHADLQAPSETSPPFDSNPPQIADTGTAADAPPVAVDAPLVSDTPVTTADAAAAANDTAHDVAAQDAPFVPVDTGPPCNGGCCGHADCPLSAPVCNAANQCVGCTADQNCSGRSATACNTTTGVCVQCTKSSQCNGTKATCDLSKNICVGCTQRSDCPGTCQTCIGGTCVALKNADDPSKCTGTCDSAGECKAKKGQKCSSVAGGCITGTTCAPDDTCCDRACSGSCEACDLATALGTCTVLAAGSDPHAGHAPCSGTGTCAGACQGASNGSCTLPTGTCGTSSCTGTTYQVAGTCNQGTCSMPAAVSCKIGATCSAGACACPGGTADCNSTCANLDSDPKNCGACGHDCLGGPCVGGFCKPYKLADVTTGYVGTLAVDGNKVYAFTDQISMFDTTKVWQMDAVTPGVAVKIPPDQRWNPNCVMDGTMVWAEGSDGTNIGFGYCSVSGCLASTKKFSHQVPASTGVEVYPVCDLANKEIVWVEVDSASPSDVRTYSIWRASVTGANLRQVTSFPLTITTANAFAGLFPSGRTDRYIFTLTDETTSRTYSVLTTTGNASPVLLASGANGGPSDLLNGPFYANDTLLVWSRDSVSYRMPLPEGVGSSAPPVFINDGILSGIMDNLHFYGFLQNRIDALHWCSPPTCSPTVLSADMSEGRKYTQDTGAIYWAVYNEAAADGFAVWKVAKQPY
jgi:hypothetical protein